MAAARVTGLLAIFHIWQSQGSREISKGLAESTQSSSSLTKKAHSPKRGRNINGKYIEIFFKIEISVSSENTVRSKSLIGLT